MDEAWHKNGFGYVNDKIILIAFDRKQQAIDRALKVGGSKFKYK